MMDNDLALFTDLYELTMVQAYFEEGMHDDAVFSLYVRRLPEQRNFLLACGLDTVLEYLEHLHFTDAHMEYLATLGMFSDRFLTWLRTLRFTGAVQAVPEGTPLFANEPILEVQAPLPEAQLVETFIMNQIHVQTVLASKAQRVVQAAAGRPVVDFGPRRMHGIDAAMKAARAFTIAGVSATSNVLAGKQYGVAVTGTMAHSYIQAHDDEAEALHAFAALYPDTVLLVDTYDTLAGVDKVIKLAERMGSDFSVRALRLDSGDLLELSKRTRSMLDRAGLTQLEIIASGGLDEERISRLLSDGAPIDGFGVGTSMGVAKDAPDLDIAYKLSEYAGKGRLKLSSNKPIWPGRKQVFRSDGNDRDVIGRADERIDGRPLLRTVMRDGKRTSEGHVSIDDIRGHARREIEALPAHIRDISPAEPPYPVEISTALSRHKQELEEKKRGGGQ